jgi:thiol-disulfide isomerase/thioredoxin
MTSCNCAFQVDFLEENGYSCKNPLSTNCSRITTISTYKEWNTFITQPGAAIIKFEPATWICPHCERIQPNYEQYAQANPRIRCAVYKITKEGLQQFPSIKHYPTFVAFKNGTFIGMTNDKTSMIDLFKQLI